MSKATLQSRVFGLHGFFLKLGPLLGSPLIKLVAWYCLYKIVTNGGLEALSFVCYEHMLREGEAEKRKKKSGTQTGVRENERPKRSV